MTTSYTGIPFGITDIPNYTLSNISSSKGNGATGTSIYTWQGTVACDANATLDMTNSTSNKYISYKNKTYGVTTQPDFCLDSKNTKVGVNVSSGKNDSGTSAKLLIMNCTVNSKTGKSPSCTATYGWNPPCPAGKYCATAKTTPVDCLQGSYCPQCPGPNCPSCSLDSFGTVCPVSGNDYAKAGNTNIGTFANIFGTIDAPISSVNYNGNNATSWSAGMCPAGYYCPTPSSTPIACPVGQTSPIGSTSNSACS
jgi:hypothetical protein